MSRKHFSSSLTSSFSLYTTRGAAGGRSPHQPGDAVELGPPDGGGAGLRVNRLSFRLEDVVILVEGVKGVGVVDVPDASVVEVRLAQPS